MFGSVPLKTYLPDGDIDLAMFQETGTKLRDSWTTDLKDFLESKTAKAAPQYRIRDVQIINAEVRQLYWLPTGLPHLPNACLAPLALCFKISPSMPRYCRKDVSC